MRVKWIKEGLEMIPLSDDLKKKVEEWATEIDHEELKKLGEYEETGDSIICSQIDPYLEGGLVVKIVKHGGKYIITAGIYEHGGYAEEYYVAEVSSNND